MNLRSCFCFLRVVGSIVHNIQATTDTNRNLIEVGSFAIFDISTFILIRNFQLLCPAIYSTSSLQNCSPRREIYYHCLLWLLAPFLSRVKYGKDLLYFPRQN